MLMEVKQYMFPQQRLRECTFKKKKSQEMLAKLN